MKNTISHQNSGDKKSVMITGAAGMMGRHFFKYYHDRDPSLLCTGFDILPYPNIAAIDIRPQSDVYHFTKKYLPGIIYHLAAQSLPTVSWEKPAETLEINGLGTINLFESIRMIKKELPDYDPIVVVACSSAEYGQSLIDCKEPIKESAELLPLHPYGVSKVTQDILSFQYWKNYGIRTIRARIFNTTGPGKTCDAVSDFISRAYAIKTGISTEFPVGNLESKRAITDVRDMIHALALLAEKGIPGETYNISGEWIYSMQDIINHLEKLLDMKFHTTVDPKLIRPVDEPVIIGDTTKLKAATGWQQQIKLETTISDMMNYVSQKTP
jgi:GDP-4-dehydro-6-deoxy-D-mannose reductase